MLGGPGLLQWLVLAFGGAMLVGNVAALLRPPTPPAKGGPGRSSAKRRPSARPSAPRTGGAQTGGARPSSSTTRAATPPRPAEPDLVAAPRARTITMAVIGGIVTLWALASLLR